MKLRQMYFDYKCGDDYLTWKVKISKEAKVGDIALPSKVVDPKDRKILLNGVLYSYPELLDIMRMLKCRKSAN